MSKSMRELIEIFFLEKEKFLEEKPLEKLKEYIDKYDRLLYTVLSDKIYESFSEIEEKEDLILRNIDILLELAFFIHCYLLKYFWISSLYIILLPP